ncbi:hypothetical protein NE237_029591 [Protea cynaroides]|uniref:Uncharacterized protein n=1 Tax=Protea cynaroides TaxID=273540 RepID=A0A9Q0JU21_9MAGN|nr:hypothetical protein NE237_029591 [Protea cynaroides]
MAKEDGLKDVDSPIRAIFCLKKNVSTEKFDERHDCFILDFDPFESVDLFNKVSHKDDDGQELSVIGQRGQVACRDYPHSRHLCTKFPFDKTAHEDYCEQCYCYVCDSIAPCKSWKKPEGRHCDATEHDESWKILRIENKPLSRLTTEAVFAAIL